MSRCVMLFSNVIFSLPFTIVYYIFQRGSPEIYIGGRSYRRYQPLISNKGASNAVLCDVILFGEVCESRFQFVYSCP